LLAESRASERASINTGSPNFILGEIENYNLPPHQKILKLHLPY